LLLKYVFVTCYFREVAEVAKYKGTRAIQVLQYSLQLWL